MRIFLRVKTGAKKNQVVKIDPSHYQVSVKARPHDGRANFLLVKILADYFQVAPSQIEIKSGYRQKSKVVIIYG